jgi:hypothetical protein
VCETGDRDQRGQRIEIPRHHPECRFRQDGEDSDRAERHHVAERNDHGRHEDGHQDERLEQAAGRHVGAHHQKGQHGAERHGDDRHAGGDRGRGEAGSPEILLAQHELIGVEPELGARLEEGLIEEALIEDQGERRQHRQRGERNHDEAEEPRAHGAPAVPLTAPSSPLATV